jgi:hypothetical protein
LARSNIKANPEGTPAKKREGGGVMTAVRAAMGAHAESAGRRRPRGAPADG